MKRTFAQMNDVPASMAAPAQPDPSDATHQPKISRKIRACKECQSRKVKCDIADGSNTCARCRRLGLKCVINKSLQTLLDDENQWKTSMENKYDQLHNAVAELLRQSNLPPLDSFSRSHSVSPSLAKAVPSSQDSAGPTPPRSDIFSPRSRQAPNVAMTRDNSPEPQSKEEDEFAPTGPMDSLFQVTKLKNLRSTTSEFPDGARRNPMYTDVISQGKISEDQAEQLFSRFNVSLNHYLWGGISLKHDNLQSVRESSSMLLASILAVTALHAPDAERELDACYSEFLALVSQSMFERYHCLDDVRALCIGAFYLSEVSWKLSGHAVRIATEMQLHISYSRAMAGSLEEIERARLWYFVYVCDHHFSLAYSRPPVIHEDETITHHERFLSLPGISNADLRLQSQVGVFAILSRVFNKFGFDSNRPLKPEDLPYIRQFNADLDRWKESWESRLAPNKYIDTYPAKGCTLHCNFAKLQLNSLCLRGISHMSLNDPRREFINIAVENASACLSFVLDEPNMRNAIVGVPLYLSTTISFAAVFLMKVHTNWKSAKLNTNFGLIVELLERIIRLLGEARASKCHVSLHTARGLTQMLQKFKEREARASSARNGVNMNHGVTRMPPNESAAAPNGWPERWQQQQQQHQQQQPQPPPLEINTQAWAGSSLDWFGLDDQYLPAGVFDAVASSLPVVGWPLNSPPSSDGLTPRMPVTAWPTSNPAFMGLPSWTTDEGTGAAAAAAAACAPAVTAASATNTPLSTYTDNSHPAWVDD